TGGEPEAVRAGRKEVPPAYFGGAGGCAVRARCGEEDQSLLVAEGAATRFGTGADPFEADSRYLRRRPPRLQAFGRLFRCMNYCEFPTENCGVPRTSEE